MYVPGPPRLALLCKNVIKLSCLDSLAFAVVLRILLYEQQNTFFRVYMIALSKHSRGLENSRKLCKSLTTTSLVYITVSNSPNPPRVQLKPKCNHGKSAFIVAVLFCIGNLLNSRQRKSFFDVVKEERSRTIKVQSVIF